MRKLAITAIALACQATVAAQSPLQCLNPHVLNGLVFQGRSDMKTDVTRTLPAAMGNLKVPVDFRLIGTGVRDGGRFTTVAFRTSLASDKAYAAALALLKADGWAEETTPGSSSTFSGASGPMFGVVCRNAARQMVAVVDVAEVRYVNIMGSPEAGGRPRDCNAPDQAMQSPMAIQQDMPRFRFPEGTSMAQGGGGGGSNDRFSNATRVITAATVGSLMQSLGEQLLAQGWRPAANWAGTGSEGATWTSLKDGRPAWGTLEITAVGERTYEVDFTMVLQP